MAQTFDVTFKLLFRRARGRLTQQLFGDVVEWLDPAQPDVRSLQADLVARCSDGSLRHVELQTTNDPSMPFRMLEYYVGLQRALRERVKQTLFYAGREPLRIPPRYESDSTLHRYSIVNLREMDGEDLLQSEDWADNEWALLTKADPERVMRIVLDKLARLDPSEQGLASATFVLIGGIIGMAAEITRRIQNEMIDVMENEVLGPAIRQGLEQGLEQGRLEGRSEGRVEGRVEGMALVLETLLEKRFGKLPATVRERLFSAPPAALASWSLHVLDAATLEEFFT